MRKLSGFLFTLFLLCISFHSSAEDPTLEIDQVLIDGTRMSQPWGMCFITSDELLFTEKDGRLYRYVISTDTKTQITGTPAVAVVGQGGLLDVALHPDFATNRYVYLSYSVSGQGGYTLAIGRGVLDGNQLTNFSQLFTALPYRTGSNHLGSRIAFDHENHLIFSSSDRQEQDNAQLLSNHIGKVIRLNDDGTVPEDNPFVGVNGVAPDIYSYGHRNIQGLVVDLRSGKIFAHEHGPMGGDELNLIEAGNNYGWPTITFGLNYDGTIIATDTARDGMEQPVRYWVPSIAPSGLAIVPVAGEEEGEVNFILGALAGKQIQWVKIKDDKHVATYSFLRDYARFRDVEVAPDGRLYALTESPNSLIRLRTNQVTTGGMAGFEPTAKSVLVYPNPAGDYIQVDVQGFAGHTMEINIFSSQGVLMTTRPEASSASGSGILKIDTRHLESGMYLLELRSESKVVPLRFAKL